MSTIKIKRSLVSGNPGTLAAGELAYSGLADSGANGGDRLYVGMGTEIAGNAANHVIIGGKYFTDMLDQVPGTLTANSAIVVDVNSAINQMFVGNLSLSGNSIATLNVDGNLILDANGTGKISFYNAYTFPKADGPAGYVLSTNGLGSIGWGSAAAAAEATSIAGGLAGQLLYQTAPGTTGFVSTATAGQFLVSGGVSTPVYVSTGSIYIGRALTGDKWTTARTVTFTGDTTGTFSIDGSADVTSVALTIQPNSVALGTDTTGDYVSNGATSGFGISGSTTGETQTFTVTSNGTSTNATGTLVYRNGGGNFSAGTITAALTGNADTATALQTPRTINGVTFSGTASITIASTTTSVLTIGTGLSGTSFNGSAPTTIAIDSTVATLLGTQTLANKKLQTPAIEGTISIFSTGTTFTEFPFSIGSMATNVNQYSQFYQQNKSNGSEASADFVVYNDRGDGVSFYLDMGINSSNFSSVSYPLFPANSSYLLAGGGDGTPGNVGPLYIGAGTTASDVVLFAGGLQTSNVRATIKGVTGNVLIGTIVDDTVSKLQVAGTATISRDLIVAGAVYSTSTITAPRQLATKQYVDQHASTGIHIHPAVRVESHSTLTAAYAVGGTVHTVTSITSGTNLVMSAPHSLLIHDQIVFDSTLYGLTSSTAYYVEHIPTSSSIQVSDNFGGAELTTLTDGTGYTLTSRANYGVGATITNTGTQARLVIGGVTVNDNDRVLVSNSQPTWRGVYTVTNTGTVSTNWELTRAVDQNKYSPSDINGMSEGDYFYITEGTPGAGESYVLSTVGDIIPGVTPTIYTLFSAAVSYTVVAPLDLTGNTLSLTGVVDATHGGTGASTVATGDLLYGSAANTWGKLGIGAAYKSLVVNAAGTQVEWNAVVLNQTGAISGQLPVASGGTGALNSATARINLGVDIGTDIPSLTGTGASGTWGIDITGAASTATHIAGGTVGQLHYQTAAGRTGFVSVGTAGQLLMSAAGAVPVYTNTASIYVGAATSAVNVFGGTAGQLHYQTAAGATSFVSTGTAGQVLVSAPGAPVYTTTGSIYVGAATSAVNVFGGTAGQLHYQTAAGATSFVSTGTAGQLLMSAPGAPVYTSTGSIQVASATSATNLFGGTANQFAYQTGPGATSFMSTSSMLVGAATTATQLSGGAAGSIPQQTAAGITSLLALGAAGKILQVSTNTSAIVWGDIDGGVY